MVILGPGGRDYRSVTEMLTAQENQVDPKAALNGADLIVYRVQRGRAIIMARGLKKSCDGTVLVLGLRRDEYDYAGGVPIIGSGGQEDVGPGDKQETTVRLAGKRVASGANYAAWLRRRGGGCSLR